MPGPSSRTVPEAWETRVGQSVSASIVKNVDSGDV